MIDKCEKMIDDLQHTPSKRAQLDGHTTAGTSPCTPTQSGTGKGKEAARSHDMPLARAMAVYKKLRPAMVILQLPLTSNSADNSTKEEQEVSTWVLELVAKRERFNISDFLSMIENCEKMINDLPHTPSKKARLDGPTTTAGTSLCTHTDTCDQQGTSSQQTQSFSELYDNLCKMFSDTCMYFHADNKPAGEQVIVIDISDDDELTIDEPASAPSTNNLNSVPIKYEENADTAKSDNEPTNEQANTNDSTVHATSQPSTSQPAGQHRFYEDISEDELATKEPGTEQPGNEIKIDPAAEQQCDYKILFTIPVSAKEQPDTEPNTTKELGAEQNSTEELGADTTIFNC